MKLDVVIVTYNRLEKLKTTLDCYRNQSRSFRNLILINNCSSDGTSEFLEEWRKEETPFNKIIVNSDYNLGGAGGFCLGQKKALELGADWVFVADDDAYPQANMIEEFLLFAQREHIDNYAAICGSVLYSDKTICYEHRSHLRKRWNSIVKIPSKSEEYQAEKFEFDLLSYVGSFINAKAMSRYGTANPDYFIYFDDTEHSLRIKRYGKIICVPQIKIVHDDRTAVSNINPDIIVSWRDYYSVRNRYHMVTRHFPLVGCVYVCSFILSKLKSFLIKRNDIRTIVLERAKMNGICGRLGIHKLYKPGWNITKVDNDF